tara:strand:- start:3130 stop:4830 length:1701 start_codon:yes stop_codon:yes gene_type:complete
MKEKISSKIAEIVESLYGSFDGSNRLDIEVNKTNDKSHGDYYTNIAMKLSKIVKNNPLSIAKEIRSAFETINDIDKIEIAAPGYINFFVSKSNKFSELTRILEDNSIFLKNNKSQNIHVEFVSANPTGPLHIGHGRGMILGDTTARFLSLQGNKVTREYYINDAGRQIDLLLVSVLLSHLNIKNHIFSDEKNSKEGHLVTYRGAYIDDVSIVIKKNLNKINKNDVLDLLDEPIDKLIAYIKNHSDYLTIRESLVNVVVDQYIKKDLSSVGVNFDNWFNESQLFESGFLKSILEEIADNDLSYSKDGALWFRNTKFGEDKDRVLIKSNGDMTYFATDIAYHVNKFKKYDILINIWGADHHDYAIRLATALKALGYDVDNRLQIHLVQFANLVRSGKSISMSTRSGDFYPIQDLVREIGDDATKYFYLTKKKEQHLEFDVDLAIKKNKNNPIYYIQYAHARITKIMSDLEKKYVEKEDFNNLNTKNEIILLEIINNYQSTMNKAISNIRPDLITNYLYKLSQAFHSYYAETKILSSKIKGEKIMLIQCIDKIILNSLSVLDIKPMDRM